MLVSRRLFSLTTAFYPAQAFVGSRFMATRTLPLLMAAPGVVVDATQDIQKALSNPDTVIVDTRRIDEIEAVGYWQTGRQWVHAPCTPDGSCPLLAVAAESLVRDTSAPVIVYCASGKRASVAKKFLEERGYKNVLNAGGYPGDFAELQ